MIVNPHESLPYFFSLSDTLRFTVISRILPWILCPRRCSRGIQERSKDRREGCENDKVSKILSLFHFVFLINIISAQYPHTTALRILLPTVLFAQKRHHLCV
jgi:hypothetical protein